MSDHASAELIRDLDVDIAVDLMGYTAGARPGILRLRGAPVQAGYLGFPGTMAVDFLDYFIADPSYSRSTSSRFSERDRPAARLLPGQ